MTKFILISANGDGNGKTTLANSLSTLRLSLADGIRQELGLKYPDINWYNKSQEYKSEARIIGGQWDTVRNMMINYGTQMRSLDENYWCKYLLNYIDSDPRYDIGTVCIDDIRYINEVELFRKTFPVTHIHIDGPVTGHPHENARLKVIADYSIQWSKI